MDLEQFSERRIGKQSRQLGYGKVRVPRLLTANRKRQRSLPNVGSLLVTKQAILWRQKGERASDRAKSRLSTGKGPGHCVLRFFKEVLHVGFLHERPTHCVHAAYYCRVADGAKLAAYRRKKRTQEQNRIFVRTSRPATIVLFGQPKETLGGAFVRNWSETLSFVDIGIEKLPIHREKCVSKSGGGYVEKNNSIL